MAGWVASYFFCFSTYDRIYRHKTLFYSSVPFLHQHSVLIERRGGGKKLVTDRDSSAEEPDRHPDVSLKRTSAHTIAWHVYYLLIYLFIISLSHPHWKLTSREHTRTVSLTLSNIYRSLTIDVISCALKSCITILTASSEHELHISIHFSSRNGPTYCTRHIHTVSPEPWWTTVVSSRALISSIPLHRSRCTVKEAGLNKNWVA